MELLLQISYLVAAICFIFGLKYLGHPDSAKNGNILSAVGMSIAIVASLMNPEIIQYWWIGVSLILGSAIGYIIAKKIPLTSMPEMVALFNGFGGIASLLVAVAVFRDSTVKNPIFSMVIASTCIVGSLTFTGSLIAFIKLSEILKIKSMLLASGRFINISLAAILFVSTALLMSGQVNPDYCTALIVASSLLLGVYMVLPIGGGDMPVVISLLNSLSGIAACAAGFLIFNNALIVSGALVGASGIILTIIMCKAMNRPLGSIIFPSNVLATQSAASEQAKSVNSCKADDAYFTLEAARSVVIVPGYGLAVAGAQHSVKELTDLLEENGTDVKYAIHPVAGRMPGHMNVLLAEAGIEYDKLIELEDINSTMEQVDACLVIGANDVVNTDARDNDTSPIYGMPIIEVDKAKNVFIFKRSMGSGFAGIQNPLFYRQNSTMIFGDAKTSLNSIITEYKH